MSVAVKVTFLDEDTRYFEIGSGPEQFFTWYARASEHHQGAPDQLVFKRYPSPSTSRVVIPLSQVRFYEVLRKDESHETTRAHHLAQAVNHPAGRALRADRGGEPALPDLAGEPEPVLSSTPPGPVLPLWQQRVVSTAEMATDPPSEPEPCAHDDSQDWESVQVFTLTGIFLGVYKRCDRCGEMRKPREPDSGVAIWNLPGQMADGRSVLGSLRRSPLRPETRAGQ